MKGLLLKDWKLLKNQRNLFVAVGAFAVFFCMMDQNLGFVVGYVTFVCAMTVLSTVTYDEFNNGNVFLFTLPLPGGSM